MADSDNSKDAIPGQPSGFVPASTVARNYRKWGPRTPRTRRSNRPASPASRPWCSYYPWAMRKRHGFLK